MAMLVAPALVQAADRVLGPVGYGSNHHRYGEVKTRLTIGAADGIQLPDSKEKKGLQLALKPLNGRSIAGYVLKP
jgi:hypothetical protein